MSLRPPQSLIRLGTDPSIPEGESTVVLWGGEADGRSMHGIHVRSTAAILVPVLGDEGWTVRRYERSLLRGRITYRSGHAVPIGPRGDV